MMILFPEMSTLPCYEWFNRINEEAVYHCVTRGRKTLVQIRSLVRQIRILSQHGNVRILYVVKFICSPRNTCNTTQTVTGCLFISKVCFFFAHLNNFFFCLLAKTYFCWPVVMFLTLHKISSICNNIISSWRKTRIKIQHSNRVDLRYVFCQKT